MSESPPSADLGGASKFPAAAVASQALATKLTAARGTQGLAAKFAAGVAPNIKGGAFAGFDTRKFAFRLSPQVNASLFAGMGMRDLATKLAEVAARDLVETFAAGVGPKVNASLFAGFGPKVNASLLAGFGPKVNASLLAGVGPKVNASLFAGMGMRDLATKLAEIGAWDLVGNFTAGVVPKVNASLFAGIDTRDLVVKLAGLDIDRPARCESALSDRGVESVLPPRQSPTWLTTRRQLGAALLVLVVGLVVETRAALPDGTADDVNNLVITVLGGVAVYLLCGR
jgi:hypothetical protein